MTSKEYNDSGYTSDSGNRYGGAKSKDLRDKYDELHGTADYMDRKSAEALKAAQEKYERDWGVGSRQDFYASPEWASFASEKGLNPSDKLSFDDTVAAQDLYKEWSDNQKRTSNGYKATYDFSSFVDEDDENRKYLRNKEWSKPEDTSAASKFQVGDEDEKEKKDLPQIEKPKSMSFDTVSTPKQDISYIADEVSTEDVNAAYKRINATPIGEEPDPKDLEIVKKAEEERKHGKGTLYDRVTSAAIDLFAGDMPEKLREGLKADIKHATPEEAEALEKAREERLKKREAPKEEPKSEAPKVEPAVAPKEEPKAEESKPKSDFGKLSSLLSEPEEKAAEEEIAEVTSMSDDELNAWISADPLATHTEHAQRIDKDFREIGELLTNENVSLSGKYQGIRDRIKDAVQGPADEVVSKLEKAPIIGPILKFGMFSLNALMYICQKLGLEKDVITKLEQEYRARWPEDKQRGSYGNEYSSGRGDIDLDSRISKYDPNLGSGAGYNKGLKEQVQPSDEDCKKFVRTMVRGQPHVRNLANKLRNGK